MPAGLVESQKLPEPIFTPSTKAAQGAHDENISPDQGSRTASAVHIASLLTVPVSPIFGQQLRNY